MKRRKEINSRLVQWITNKVETEYPDDISLVCIYGSYLSGTMNSRSDVDCYFVPKTQRGNEMAATFILDGVGYDIFPMSWERLEAIADLRTGLQPLIGDARIIYCGDHHDETRFRSLQAQLKRSLQDDAYVQMIATHRCKEAARLFASVDPDEAPSVILKTLGRMIMALADAVAIQNHDYYHFGLKKQYEELQSRFPGHIAEGYRSVIEADDAAQAYRRAALLLEDVCACIGVKCEPQAVPEERPHAAAQPDAFALAELYQEICSTFNKIYVCCENGNHILAFLSAVCLQGDLDEAVELGCPRYDLLQSFHCQSLPEFSDAARQIEEDLVRFIQTSGGHIASFDSFEQFEAAHKLT